MMLSSSAFLRRRRHLRLCVVVVVVCVVRRHIGFRTITLINMNGSLKFYKKVHYHKGKFRIDFGDDGPNHLGTRGPKQAFFYFQDNYLCISISIVWNCSTMFNTTSRRFGFILEVMVPTDLELRAKKMGQTQAFL